MKSIKKLYFLFLLVAFCSTIISCGSDEPTELEVIQMELDQIKSLSDTLVLSGTDGKIQRFTTLELYAQFIAELQRVDKFNKQVAKKLNIPYQSNETIKQPSAPNVVQQQSRPVVQQPQNQLPQNHIAQPNNQSVNNPNTPTQ